MIINNLPFGDISIYSTISGDIQYIVPCIFGDISIYSNNNHSYPTREDSLELNGLD
jgi:hypothetical protein